MRIDTSKGGSFEADLVYKIHIGGDYLLIQLRDPKGRKLSRIAADFEGLTSITCEDGREYTEYTDLRVVSRQGEQTLQLQLYKEGAL